MIFLGSGFLHESIVHRPWSNILKYFLKYFCFCRDINENISDFRVTIPRNRENSSLMSTFFLRSNHNSMYVHVAHSWFLYIYLISNLLKLFKIFKKWVFLRNSISGYCNPEIDQFPVNNTQLLLTSEYRYL